MSARSPISNRMDITVDVMLSFGINVFYGNEFFGILCGNVPHH